MLKYLFRMIVMVTVMTHTTANAKTLRLDLDKLPEPIHLSRVLDSAVFLGGKNARPPRVGTRYVQVAAFKRRETASKQAQKILTGGFLTVLGTEKKRHLVLMVETKKNGADSLAVWARQNGYPDAFIRIIK